MGRTFGTFVKRAGGEGRSFNAAIAKRNGADVEVLRQLAEAGSLRAVDRARLRVRRGARSTGPHRDRPRRRQARDRRRPVRRRTFRCSHCLRRAPDGLAPEADPDRSRTSHAAVDAAGQHVVSRSAAAGPREPPSDVPGARPHKPSDQPEVHHRAPRRALTCALTRVHVGPFIRCGRDEVTWLHGP